MNGNRWGVLALILLAAGCGSSGPPAPQLGVVKGTVTLDGHPLPRATVVYIPISDGHAASGVTDENGQYELTYEPGKPGAPLGLHRVEIRTGGESLDKEGNMISETPEILPEQYNVQTRLAQEVKPEGNTIDFELNSRPKGR